MRVLSSTMLCLCFGLAACSSELDPFSEGDRYFAIFGFLDTEADTQYVRIDPARRTPEAFAVNTSNLSVRIEEQMRQSVTRWADSILILDDGTRGILYYAKLKPEPDREYTLVVQRSDGAQSSARTRTPKSPDLETRPIQSTIANTIEQDILLHGVHRVPDEIEMRYRVGSRFAPEPVDVLLDYGIAGGFEEDAWRVTIRLTRDVDQIRNRLSLTASDTLALYETAIQIRLLSDDWPINANDPYTNVTNGFGFFGSTARFERAWRLTDETVDELRLINRQQ